MACHTTITIDSARVAAKKIGFEFKDELFTVADFRRGMKIELEHGKCLEGTPSPQTNVTNNDLQKTGQIALAHLREDFRYYDLKIGLPAWEKGLKKTRKAAEKAARSKNI
jgi:hypothetical protein